MMMMTLQKEHPSSCGRKMMMKFEPAALRLDDDDGSKTRRRREIAEA